MGAWARSCCHTALALTRDHLNALAFTLGRPGCALRHSSAEAHSTYLVYSAGGTAQSMHGLMREGVHIITKRSS